MAFSPEARVYDELLVILVQSGDRKAGERLAARWHPRLLAASRRILRDHEAARDAAQEAWTGITKGLPQLADPARFPAWAFGILHRKCIDQMRSAERRPVPVDSGAHDGPARRERLDERHDLTAAFASLSPDHRIAATLYFAQGLTLGEVAIATKVPVGTAKSRIFHARQHLKYSLTGESHD